MAADVVEGPDLLFRIAHQQHRPTGDGDRHDIAGPGQLMGKAGEDPGVGEDALVLELEDRFARIGRSRQSLRHGPRSLECGQSLGPQDRLQRQAHGDPLCDPPLERAPAKARGP